MIEAIKKGNITEVSGKFNDIELVANFSSTADSVVKKFENECSLRSIAYRNSPEGRAAEASNIRQKNKAQETVNNLMKELPSLDFKNNVKVLDWINRLQPASDYVGVEVSSKKIVEIFADHGFLPGVNIGANFKENDEDNFAKYIAGQALGFLEKGWPVHHVVGRFIDDWKKKFKKGNISA